MSAIDSSKPSTVEDIEKLMEEAARVCGGRNPRRCAAIACTLENAIDPRFKDVAERGARMASFYHNHAREGASPEVVAGVCRIAGIRITDLQNG